ncbi:MAG: hypothetical protein EA357_03890 [Micavibrio sp.]|nr:MAG: hypothetical protein EA357_03890 [Micavibrio sp.]
MSTLPWWIYALYVSFGNAIRSNLNSHYKADGVRARLWSSFVGAVLLSPALFLAQWPSNIEFYLSLAVVCGLSSMLSVKLLDLSARYGGPVATLSRPFHVFFSFFLWGVIVFDETIEMMSDPFVAVGVIAAFLLASAAQFSMYKNGLDIKQALRELIIVAAGGAVMAVVVKYGMLFTDHFMQILLWVCLTQSGVFVLSCIRARLRYPVAEICDRHIMKAGTVMGVMNAAVIPVLILSLKLTPNPAFTSMIFMLATVWLMVYYKIRGQDARVKPVQIAMLLFAAVLLIASTNKI